uniref:ShKT domain-containing protein n=2 Tax=Clytia hemisphaerica TaxID=252671 RepID=A0A7M5WRT9_9CNID
MEFKMNTKLIVLVIVHLLTKSIQVTAKGLTCTDKRTDCFTLSQFGWCKKRANDMKKVCKKTCKFCTGDIGTDRLQTTLTATRPLNSKCIDYRSDCTSLMKRGWCKSRATIMETTCKSTCNFCPKPTPQTSVRRCLDKRKDCPRLKSFKWCTSNKRIMKIVCPKTCQLCEKTTIPTTLVATTQTDCHDRRSDCANLKNRGWCTQYKNYLKARCPRTCGFCGQNKVLTTKTTTSTSTTPTTTTTTPTTTTTTPTTTTTTPTTTTTTTTTPVQENKQTTETECIDKRLDCYRLGIRYKYCTLFPDLVKLICSRTCQFCTVKDSSSVVPTTRRITTLKPTQRTTTTESCLDKGSDCYRLANVYNWCQVNPNRMKVSCKRTCRFCNGMTPLTFTTTTPSTTTTTIPTTTTTTPTTTTTTTTTTPTTTTTTPTTTTTTTTTTPTTTTTTTPTTTTTTTTPTTTTTTTTTTPRTTTVATTKECIDKRPDCSNYRTFGWCHSQSRGSIMKIICAATCGYCRKAPPTMATTTTEELGQQVMTTLSSYVKGIIRDNTNSDNNLRVCHLF